MALPLYNFAMKYSRVVPQHSPVESLNVGSNPKELLRVSTGCKLGLHAHREKGEEDVSLVTF